MQPDVTPFLVESMKDVTFIKPPANPERPDWRDKAVYEVLRNFSKSDWVLFLEQDFLFKNSRLLERAFKREDLDAVLYMEGTRIHPAFALVRRAVMGRTSFDFAASPPSHDHFGLFFKELADSCTWIELRDAGLEDKKDFYHMAGLTHNYYCYDNEQPLYKPEEFLTYNHYILDLPVPQQNAFINNCWRIDKLYDPNFEVKYIRSFFN